MRQTPAAPPAPPHPLPQQHAEPDEAAETRQAARRTAAPHRQHSGPAPERLQRLPRPGLNTLTTRDEDRITAHRHLEHLSGRAAQAADAHSLAGVLADLTTPDAILERVDDVVLRVRLSGDDRSPLPTGRQEAAVVLLSTALGDISRLAMLVNDARGQTSGAAPAPPPGTPVAPPLGCGRPQPLTTPHRSFPPESSFPCPRRPRSPTSWPRPAISPAEAAGTTSPNSSITATAGTTPRKPTSTPA
ncbi:hypothetical protein [Streptomyces acidiscabies]|uniref:hypothetical protein n=1 Tax=Streptomyces acidiscabies TaxID=42234 RepID=UPI001FF56D87|nr:hypothetical protein [Streptomyces acidiscabies]